jgi:exopolysaccharide production protein ExoZ
LRGVAALGVVLCHGAGFPLGAAGVDLFFVISGFIIGTVAVGRRPLEFLWARLWRIFPMLWLCSLPWIGLAFYLGSATLPRTISSLTLWPVFGSYAWPYLRPAWSLCFEMLFYLAVTFAMLTRAWIPLAIFAVCCAANLLWSSPLLGFLGYPLIFNFLMGLAITKLPKNPRLAPLAIVAVAVMALAPVATFADFTIGISGPVALERVALWGIPSAVIVYAAIAVDNAPAPLVALGDASYSIYLTHLVALLFLSGWLGVGVAILVGLVVHRYVEKPLMSLKPSFLGTWRWGRGTQPYTAPLQ